MKGDSIQALAEQLAHHWQRVVPAWSGPSAGQACVSVGAAVPAEQLAGALLNVRPETEQDAYAVQDAVLALLGPARAWKVGRGGLGTISCAPIYARIFADGRDAEHTVSLPANYDGLEVEVAYRLGADLPPSDQPYTREAVLAAIGSTHVTLELLAPRCQQPTETWEHLLTLADGLASGGLVVGSGQPGVVDVDGATLHARIAVDGAAVFDEAVVDDRPYGPLDLTVWLANHLSRRGVGLQAGQVVTTGSWVGKQPMVAGEQLLASLGDIGTVVARCAPTAQ